MGTTFPNLDENALPLSPDLADTECINIRPFDRNGSPQGQSFQDNIEDAIQKCLYHVGKRHHVYVGVNPRDRDKVLEEKTKKGHPGGKAAVSRVRTLFSDYDCDKFGKSKEQGLEELRNNYCPPSMIVDSGRGLQPYWILKIPVSSKLDFSHS